jgi:hypothetical protein
MYQEITEDDKIVDLIEFGDDLIVGTSETEAKDKQQSP